MTDESAKTFSKLAISWRVERSEALASFGFVHFEDKLKASIHTSLRRRTNWVVKA